MDSWNITPEDIIEKTNAFVDNSKNNNAQLVSKNLTKEDGSKPSVGDTLDFKVIEFSKGEKRILLSHTATYKEDEKPVAKKKPAGKKKSSGSSNQEATSSLGDLSALSALKEQMEVKADLV